MNSEVTKRLKLNRARRILGLSFVLPFFLIACIWTVIDYCDISSGLEHEREIGVRHSITEQEILLGSLKKSLILAIPSGLIGLVVGIVYLKQNEKSDDSVQ